MALRPTRSVALPAVLLTITALTACNSGGEVPESDETIGADRDVVPPQDVPCEDLVEAPLDEELAGDPVCQGTDGSVTDWADECEDGSVLARLDEADAGVSAWAFAGEQWQVGGDLDSDPDYQAAVADC